MFLESDNHFSSIDTLWTPLTTNCSGGTYKRIRKLRQYMKDAPCMISSKVLEQILMHAFINTVVVCVTDKCFKIYVCVFNDTNDILRVLHFLCSYIVTEFLFAAIRAWHVLPKWSKLVKNHETTTKSNRIIVQSKTKKRFNKH